MALLTRVIVCGVLLLGGLDVSAQTPSKEYQVKAVFLFNFAQFVEWPPTAFPDTNAPLIIGVLGEDPFGAFLDEIVRGETVNSRPLVVQRYRSVNEITTCHILFVSRSEAGRLDQTLASLKDRNILTVGDADDFVRRGGTVQLANAQNKVRLVINPDAAKAANLTISSKLLRAAEIVTPSR